MRPVGRIIIGTMTVSGRLIFILQANDDQDVVSMRLEREQVYALVHGIEEILKELEDAEVHPTSTSEEPESLDLALIEPVDVAFSAGHMGMAYDRASDLLLLIIQQTEQEKPEGGAQVRLWVSCGQAQALCKLTREALVVSMIFCPLCQKLVEPGHFCPKGNGHSKRNDEA